MKKTLKRIMPIVLATMLFSLLCVNSFAAVGNGYGLEMKVKAQGNELTASLTNSNSFDVDGVTVSVGVPQGLSVGSPEAVEIGSLASGASGKADFCLSASTAKMSPASDMSTAETVVIALFLLLAATVGALIVFKSRKAKKAAATLVCLLLLLPVFNSFAVNAVGVGEEDSFSVTEKVTLDGKEYSVTLTAKYLADSSKESYFEIVSDAETAGKASAEEAKVLTEARLPVSGTAAARGSIKSVEYQVFSEADNYENGTTGTAQLDGCSFDAGDVMLKPGKNKVTVIATDLDGNKKTETYEITYDRGKAYDYKQSDISTANDGTRFLNNIVTVYFETDTDDARRAEIVSSIGGEVVGKLNGVEMYQIKVETSSLPELQEICDGLDKLPEISSATTEQLFSFEDQATPNDPWTYTPSGSSASWNEALPGGNNWSVEAIQALSAWDYDSWFSHVNIGVVDSGFMLDHEDLTGVFNTSLLATNTPGNHGTHVAGIMAALANNSKGVTGVLWDTTVYCATYNSSSTISDIIDTIASEIEHGAKSVNMSLGLSPKPYGESYADNELISQVLDCASTINNLVNNGYEFVIAQSAGNGAYDSRLGSNASDSNNKRSINTLQNGMFCSMTVEKLVANGYSQARAQLIFDHTLSVAAVGNNTTSAGGPRFVQGFFSNAGDRVDIAAPGLSVLSATTPNTQGSTTYNYGGMSGTSMASPIVAAVAGLCFSVNPNLTGPQVKAMLCSEETTCYVAEDNTQTKTVDGVVYELHPLVNTYRVVNAKLAVEAALRTVCGLANYNYLNSLVSAANALDPTDYYDFSQVSSIIASIDYTLYAYRQVDVDAKAQELLNAIGSLQEHPRADYTQVDAAVEQANAMSPGLYVDFSPVQAAVEAVVYGKYLEEQNAVNAMAQAITDAIAALVRKMTVNSSTPATVTVDNEKQLVVITVDKIFDFDDSLSVSDGTIRYVPYNGSYSTGSTIELVNASDEVVTSYTVVAFGDIDGNGSIDGFDAFITGAIADGLITEYTDITDIAADLSGDGSIDEADVDLIGQAALKKYTPGNSYIP